MAHAGTTVYSFKVSVQMSCRLVFQVLKQLTVKLKERSKELCFIPFFVWGPEELFLGVTKFRGKLELQHINHLKAPRDT